LVFLTIHPVFVRPAIGTMGQGLERQPLADSQLTRL